MKLQPGRDLLEAQAQLQQALDQGGAQVTVLTWQKAVGEVAQFASITQGALFVFVLFIFFVAIIVIMNTLSMAALERIAEIGMMRAIGAQRALSARCFSPKRLSWPSFSAAAGLTRRRGCIVADIGVGNLRHRLTNC